SPAHSPEWASNPGPVFHLPTLTALDRHLLEHGSHVDDLARDRRRRDHRRTHEQRPARRASHPSLEIAIGRGRADLPALEAFGVHAEAHRAARPTPFKTGLFEDAVQTARFGVPPDDVRAGDDERLHVGCDAASLYQACRLLEV